MVRYIWKFPLPDGGRFSITMPKDTKLMSVQMQGNDPVMWGFFELGSPHVERSFAWYGTGWALEEAEIGTYVGTVQMPDGFHVYHLFDLGES